MSASVGQTSKGVGTAVSSQATGATGSSTVTGSTFVVGVIFDSAITFTSIVDNKSNTYTQIGSELTGSVDTDKTRLYYSANGAGGSGHTATITLSGNSRITVIFLEILSADTAAPLDGAASGLVDAATPYTSPNLGTSGTDDMLVATIFVLFSVSWTYSIELTMLLSIYCILF